MVTSNKARYRYNPTPRLSANQLSEYLTASSTRRKSIIRDAKFPGTVIIARYDVAKEALRKHLSDPTRSHHMLTSAILDLTKKGEHPSASTWVRGDCLCSIEAIATFQKASNQLGLSTYNFRPIPARQPSLTINGVKVSVTLDLIAHRTSKDGTSHIGGVILMVSKSDAASKNRADRCQAAAVLALQSVEQNFATSGTLDPKLCMSIDILGSTVYFAKGNYKRLLGTIESSCDEIADRWDSITPPDGYDGPSVD